MTHCGCDPNLLHRSSEWMMKHTYFLQSALDNVMSPIIWTGAYNHALERGASHDDAVRLADGAVFGDGDQRKAVRDVGRSSR